MLLGLKYNFLMADTKKKGNVKKEFLKKIGGLYNTKFN